MRTAKIKTEKKLRQIRGKKVKMKLNKNFDEIDI